MVNLGFTQYCDQHSYVSLQKGTRTKDELTQVIADRHACSDGCVRQCLG